MHRVEFRRIALNQDQILALALPPNPVKMNDSRAAKYMRYMTTSAFADPSFCWEVDALTPPQITAVLRDALTSMIDQQSWQASLRQEELEKQQVSAVAGRWDEVQAFLAGGQLPT
jgi:hypothetical protein